MRRTRVSMPYIKECDTRRNQNQHATQLKLNNNHLCLVCTPKLVIDEFTSPHRSDLVAQPGGAFCDLHKTIEI